MNSFRASTIERALWAAAASGYGGSGCEASMRLKDLARYKEFRA